MNISNFNHLKHDFSKGHYINNIFNKNELRRNKGIIKIYEKSYKNHLNIGS